MTGTLKFWDYLAAAVVDRMRIQNSAPVQSTEAIKQIFQKEYDIEVSEFQADLTAHRLEQLSFIKLLTDEYAGLMLYPKSNIDVLIQIQHAENLIPDSTFVQALSGGKRLLSRVFKNKGFWEDFADSVAKIGKNEGTDNPALTLDVPASDRTVTLTHNQQLELESDADELVKSLSQENSINGDVSLREVILAQVRAGRELIRTQCIRVYLVQVTLVDALGSLIKVYGDKAIGVLAKKLLDRLIEYVLGK